MLQTSHVASCTPLPVDLPPVTPLNVPRRQSLSTETVGAESAYAAAHSRLASASWATRLPSITIDVSSEARPKIRPLPIPPKSAPPVPRRQVSQNSLRPLPCVPKSATGVTVSVTPATPLTPTMHVVQSITHLSPPPTVTLPQRFASLSLRLDTSPDALRPRNSDPTPSFPSPSIPELSSDALHPRTADPTPSSPSPSIPEPPSPSTAHRKRLSKLRRHLGESVPLELLPVAGRADRASREKHVYSQTVIAVKKLLDLDGDDSDTTSEDEEDRYSLVFTHGQTHRTIPVKRYSRKWVRENSGGDRWVEENYSNILRELRAL
ncbi:hypothetical protein B0H12DRAFT_1233764 [Mycena haematopus]|nr:hypothetical protein B0H12DRAFT_1233764 [Mycena haematopus]